LKAVVLLSGGLDSVVNLKCAFDEGEVVEALTFDYGQSAFADEKRAAASCAGRLGVPHRTVELGWYRTLVPGPIAGRGDVASYPAGLPQDRDRLLREAWVPNRNCVFISIGAAFAEARGADRVVIGLNSEEAETFPDNSKPFLDSMNAVLAVSTLTAVQAVTYTGALSKAEIVELGIRVGAPLDVVYSCYRGSDDHRMCGCCQSCVRLKRALEAKNAAGLLKGRFAR
jgi:7-cyano-7-deazaguanine synthase